MNGHVMKTIVAQVENPELVEKRHTQIFQAAVKLFARKGYHQTTMRDIAAASGINLSYLYRYISTKNDILYLFYERLHTLFHPCYPDPEAPDGEDPVRQVRRIIARVLEMVHEYREEFLAMYTESRHLEPDSLRAVLSKESALIQSLDHIIRRGRETGCFQTQDPFMAANIIQYLLLIEPLRGWNFRKRYDFSAFVDSVTRFILRGLGAREETNTFASPNGSKTKRDEA